MLIFVLCYASALTVLVSLYMAHDISPRGLGFAGLALMVVGFVVLTRYLRRAQKLPSLIESGELTPEVTKRIRRQILSLRIYVGGLVLGLIMALSDFRSLPAISIVVGVAINQLLMWSCIKRINQLKKRLNSEAISAA
jgi:hypothetical protein